MTSPNDSGRSSTASCICGETALTDRDAANVQRNPVNGHCAWCPKRFDRKDRDDTRPATAVSPEVRADALRQANLLEDVARWARDPSRGQDDVRLSPEGAEKIAANIRALLQGGHAPVAEPPTELPDMSKVTRFEVIDDRVDAPNPGRCFVAWNASGNMQFQDGGRTLKMFITAEPKEGAREPGVEPIVPATIGNTSGDSGRSGSALLPDSPPAGPTIADVEALQRIGDSVAVPHTTLTEEERAEAESWARFYEEEGKGDMRDTLLARGLRALLSGYAVQESPPTPDLVPLDVEADECDRGPDCAICEQMRERGEAPGRVP